MNVLTRTWNWLSPGERFAAGGVVLGFVAAAGAVGLTSTPAMTAEEERVQIKAHCVQRSEFYGAEAPRYSQACEAFKLSQSTRGNAVLGYQLRSAIKPTNDKVAYKFLQLAMEDK